MIIAVLLLLLAMSCLFWRLHYKKIATSLLGLLVVSFFAVGCGFLPKYMLRNLQQATIQVPEIQWQQPTRIVLLAGGATKISGTDRVVPAIMTYSRIMMAAKLYLACQAAHGQCVIVGSGQERERVDEAKSYSVELLALGIPKNAIQLTSGSRNTYQEARYVASLPKGSQIVLVTSGFHLRRAIQDFARAGLTVTPVAADYLKANLSFLPTAYHFELMDIALHEYLGYLTLAWLDNPLYQCLAQL